MTLTLSTRAFTYDADSKTFSAEASDLGMSGVLFGTGFKLRSVRTGDEVEFTHFDTHRDNEGDVMYDDFVPAIRVGRGEYVRDHSKPWRVRIWND